MDDFSSKDAGDQLDDDITDAIPVSLAEATAPSPHFAKARAVHFATKTLNQDIDDVTIEDPRILAEILSKSKEEYIEEKRRRSKENDEIKSALNESLKSQNLSIQSQDDFRFGDSALQRSTAAMSSTNIRYSKFNTSKSMSYQGHNSNKSATVTSVNAYN